MFRWGGTGSFSTLRAHFHITPPVFRSHLRGERLRDVYQFRGLSTSQTRAAKIKVTARNIRGNLLVQLGSYGLAANP